MTSCKKNYCRNRLWLALKKKYQINSRPHSSPDWKKCNATPFHVEATEHLHYDFNQRKHVANKPSLYHSMFKLELNRQQQFLSCQHSYWSRQLGSHPIHKEGTQQVLFHFEMEIWHQKAWAVWPRCCSVPRHDDSKTKPRFTREKMPLSGFDWGKKICTSTIRWPQL